MGWGGINIDSNTGSNLGRNAVGVGTGGTVQDVEGAWGDVSGQNARDATKDAYNNAYNTGQQAYGSMMGQNAVMDKEGQNYASGVKDAYNQVIGGIQQPFDDYDKSISSMMKASENQANDARKTYNGSIEPMMRSNMEAANRNAQASMTLSDAMNPNNALASGIRQQYDSQAQGAMQQGTASSGVLQALGGLQLGMAQQQGPMTGSQQQATYANATQAAGDRMGQGIQQAADIRDAGDQAAQTQTNNMYNAGLQARTNASNTTADYLGAGRSSRGQSQASRQELAAMGKEQADAKSGKETSIKSMFTQMNQADTEEAKRKAERDAAAVNAKYGTQIAARGGEAAARTANANGQGNTILGAAGHIAGAFAGAG